MELKFTKMHGLGNDFVMIDNINGSIDINSDQIRYIADRHSGIGCDHVLVIYPSKDPSVEVMFRIFNADGNEAEQSGNGARCLGKYLFDNGLVETKEFNTENVKGIVKIIIDNEESIRVNMGRPVFEPNEIPLLSDNQQSVYTIELGNVSVEVSVLSMGNPHAVLNVDDVQLAEVEVWGKKIQENSMFPESVNVGFMQIMGRGSIRLRVYERGVGETQACGSGACAAVVAGIMENKLDNNVVVELKKGNIVINWAGEGNEVWMTGPATTVFEGQITV